MLTYHTKDLSVKDRQNFLTSGIGPRPIALVSTLSKDGKPNLAPFSFFNAFGANPPTIAFSPARRGRDGSLKDTYHNVRDTKECVVAMVSYDMVEQISLASSEYDEHINEFIKSGLTPIKSDSIKPSGILESPIWFECIVKDIIHTGESNGAGNIVICEIVVFHINENILTEDSIDPHKADIVGRFGSNDYVRASGDAIFSVSKPTSKGMGFDQIPEHILSSHTLSANNIARLANQESIPSQKECLTFLDSISEIEFSKFDFLRAERLKDSNKMLQFFKYAFKNEDNSYKEYRDRTAKILIELEHPEDAWKLLQLV